MNFAFSPEQEEFRQSLRRFLADKSPAAEVRRLMETDAGYDPQVWKQLADQLGLQGLAIPEEFGGSGATPVNWASPSRRWAGCCCARRSSPRWDWPPRRCWPPGDDQAKREYLPRIADGSLLATVAVTEEDGRWDLSRGADLGGRCQRRRAAFQLDGTKMFVVDGHIAQVLLVVARTDGGLGLFAVDALTPASCAPRWRRLT